MKNIAILGSTGSIGRQTLQIVRNLSGRFRVVGLAAGQNTGLLEKQIAEFKPEFIYYRDHAERHINTGSSKFLPLEEIAARPEVDTVIVATSGKAGLTATLRAVKEGKNVAIANKEPLVMAGEIITHEARQNNAKILPIDSEHSAIWQCLSGEPQPPHRIILTASGGPFRNYSQEQLIAVTPEQALNHPSWQMGKKVTIDSATLMNKGLEIMEARWLFDVPIDDISVMVHPQSIIHSMVEFADGSLKAQLSYPDMRIPIQYALTYPEHVANPDLPKLDRTKLKELTFESPDFKKSPCLELAIQAARTGGTSPAVLCAADEIAVEMFLKESIRFTDIASIVKQVLDRHESITNPTIEDILTADEWARARAGEIIQQGKKCF